MNEYKTALDVNWQLSNKKLPKTEFYSHLLTDGPVITVNSLKGIIEIERMEINLPAPAPAFGSAVQLYINNPSLLLTEANKDNIYMQLTPYYKPADDGAPIPTITDSAIPYVISNGTFVPSGVGIQVYNASPALALADQWEGKFYLYFEIYTRN